jgi:hypothetical protein
LELLRWAYEDFKAIQEMAGLPMPVNEDIASDQHKDKLLRKLACAVIRHLHEIIEKQPKGGYPDVGEFIEPFDTVRGLFTEGGHVYPCAGFEVRSHTQVAVRNDACIKGVFLPR